jgi:hypothetical protein
MSNTIVSLLKNWPLIAGSAHSTRLMQFDKMFEKRKHFSKITKTASWPTLETRMVTTQTQQPGKASFVVGNAYACSKH